MRIVVTHMSTDVNKGDFAILAATVRGLRSTFPNAEITVVSVERGRQFSESDRRLTTELGVEILGTLQPPLAATSSPVRWVIDVVSSELCLLSLRVLGPRAIRVMPPRQRQFFETFRTADLTIAKGGSYLYSHGGLRQDLFLTRMLYLLRAALAVRRPALLLGVSLGPFSRFARARARRVLRRSRFVYLREQRSLPVAVEELGIRPEIVSVVPDIAFSLPSVTAERPRAGIGVTVRDLPFRDAQDPRRARDAYRGAVLAALSDLLERHADAQVVFVPQAFSDVPLAKSLAQRLDASDRVSVLDRDLTLDELLYTYGGLDFVIATRLHSVILAAVMGTPALHIAYERQKGLGIMEMLGMDRWVIPAAELNDENLSALVAAFDGELDGIRTHLRDRLQELRQQLDDIFAVLERMPSSHQPHSNE